MAKLIYDRDGEFELSTTRGRKLEPHVEHPIPDALAAEIHAALPHWEAAGFRLLGYAAPAPVTE